MTLEPHPSALVAIARRRGVRRFDPARPLDDEVLEQVLRAATLAPSGGNLQPWRFVVLRGEASRRRLRACAFNHPVLADAPVALIVAGYHNPHRSHLDAIVGRQLELGAVTPAEAAEARARTARAMERTPDLAHWAARTTMLGVATLLIAAEALGVGSALLEAFDPRQVKDAFGIPDDHTVCCLVALGFAAAEEPFPGRLGLGEVCYREHFGQPWGSA